MKRHVIDVLEEYRIFHKLTKWQLARILGISAPFYSQCLMGVSGMGTRVVDAACEFFPKLREQIDLTNQTPRERNQ